MWLRIDDCTTAAALVAVILSACSIIYIADKQFQNPLEDGWGNEPHSVRAFRALSCTVLALNALTVLSMAAVAARITFVAKRRERIVAGVCITLAVAHIFPFVAVGVLDAGVFPGIDYKLRRHMTHRLCTVAAIVVACALFISVADVLPCCRRDVPDGFDDASSALATSEGGTSLTCFSGNTDGSDPPRITPSQPPVV